MNTNRQKGMEQKWCKDSTYFGWGINFNRFTCFEAVGSDPMGDSMKL